MMHELTDYAEDLPPAPPRTRYVLVAEEIVQQLSTEWSQPVRLRITEDDGRVLKLIVQQEYPR